MLLAAVALTVPLGPPAPRVRHVHLAASPRYWPEQGFVEMVPPLRFPSSPDGRDIIKVWLRLPPDGALDVRWLPDQQRHVLGYPPGTEAARVEHFGNPAGDPRRWVVADVRGTRLEAGGGETFYVLRPARFAPLSPLRGVAWRRGDRAQQAEATRALGEIVRRTVVPGASAAARERAAAHVMRLNDCAACHAHNRPEQTGPTGAPLPRRATDAAGFYAVSAVLRDGGPLEDYRPRDMNVGDPFVRLSCGAAPARIARGPGGAVAVRCDDGSTPVGVRDVVAALRAGDPRARRVCASRRYLFARMTAAARAAFADAFVACGIGPRTLAPELRQAGR